MAAQGEPEVLVVGAGPVGLLAALWLAEGGVKVVIIDQAGRTTTEQPRLCNPSAHTQTP